MAMTITMALTATIPMTAETATTYNGYDSYDSYDGYNGYLMMKSA